MRISHTEQLIIHLLRVECLRHRLRHDRHLLQEQRPLFHLHLEKLRILVILIKKKRISVEMLIITDHDITRLQFPHKIRIRPLFDHLNTITDQAHTKLLQTVVPDIITNTSFRREPEFLLKLTFKHTDARI